MCIYLFSVSGTYPVHLICFDFIILICIVRNTIYETDHYVSPASYCVIPLEHNYSSQQTVVSHLQPTFVPTFHSHKSY
jgi:hypothetical protein